MYRCIKIIGVDEIIWGKNIIEERSGVGFRINFKDMLIFRG